MGSTKKTDPKKKKGGAAVFDEAALSQLTSTIDKTLSTLDGQSAPPPPASKRKRTRGEDDEPSPKRVQTQSTSPGKRKRTAEQQSKSVSRSALLEEILALGGDEDDLDLVANLDSDNEDGGGQKSAPSADAVADESLRDELAKFASSLGFHNLPQDDADTDEELEDAEVAFAQEPPETQRTEERKDEVAPERPQEARRGKDSGKLVFEPRPDWHGLNMEGLPLDAPQDAIYRPAVVANLKVYAESLLAEDATTYSAMQSSSSTQKFMSTIMSSGTLSDKVSALTLSIQESPLHNQKAFESLITLAGKKSRGQAIAALGALVDLLGNGNVLPSDRRLRHFNAQPTLLHIIHEQAISSWTQSQQLPGGLTKAHLMMWAYEDWLKSAYFRIIQLLEVWCADEIEYSRSRALDFVFGLLRDKPEQEANLLRLLVNKLGDRDRKIASRASYLLLQLLNVHPGMKAVVVKAIEHEVLLKPGQSIRTRYYAINTLNQTILSTKEPAVADSLLRIYFDAFLSLLKTGSLEGLESLQSNAEAQSGNKKNKKRKDHNANVPANEQETAQKLVSALLTGVNRAIPFTTADDLTLEKHLDTLFRITHSSNFNTSVQALMLIQQLAASKSLAVERFYRTLYESLLDPRLITSSKQALYLNLLFRSLKNDADPRRVKAFVKRLVQILNLHQPSFACGILYMIAELEKSFSDLHALLDVPEDNDDDGDEVYKDVREDEAPRQAETSAPQRTAAYDGRKRDPEHSNAHKSCLWEITPFFSHFHPSVRVFAENLLYRDNKLPKPDLANHNLMHFLDKFVYRNAKATDTKRGGSIMQPVLASGSSSQTVISSKANARQQQTVNSASFWNLKPEQVPAEDVFFHEYFARIGKPGESTKAKKPAKKEAESEDEEAEEEIWDALVNSRPEVEGDGEDDSDLEMEDYDDSDEEIDMASVDGKPDLSDDASDDGFEGIFDDSGDDDESEEDAEADKTDSSRDKGKGRLNRKELKSLPTFASAEDYAEMLAGEDDLDG